MASHLQYYTLWHYSSLIFNTPRNYCHNLLSISAQKIIEISDNQICCVNVFYNVHAMLITDAYRKYSDFKQECIYGQFVKLYLMEKAISFSQTSYSTLNISKSLLILKFPITMMFVLTVKFN